jgi:hypothetical protein
MKKHASLAIISLLSIGALSACGSPGGGSGGKGGKGNQGGEGDEGGGGSGGTGGKVVPKDAAPPRDTGTAPVDAGSPADLGADGSTGGCEGPPESILCKPLGKMPMSLKETGFFPTPTDLTKHPAAMREYVPDPPLWSDGMEKQRFLVLPAGMKIDNTDRKMWVFPEGTIFIKTFFDDTGPGGQKKPIETRFIRKKNVYEFYNYKWNADGADATLLLDADNGIGGDINADENVPITIKHMSDGKMLTVNGGMPFMHTLPSRQACGNCHEENAMHAQTIIGFDELRLNSKFPKTAAKTQLEDFGGDPKTSVFTMPIPTAPATITDADPRLLRIKRFVFGNCVHCHSLGSGVFDMRPEVFVANTVNKPTNAQSVEPPAGWMRIKPGFPGQSVIYVQSQRTMIPTMVGGKPVKLRPMPPVGVADVAAEQEFLTDLAAWITALPK